MTHRKSGSESVVTGNVILGLPLPVSFPRLGTMRRTTCYTVSQGTGHRLLVGGQQNVPPPPDVPPPLPPKRTTSLLGTTLRHKQRESSTLNPKRISIATSSFWDGHPDMAHFVSGWELGCDRLDSTNSVWNTTERGTSEQINIWGDPPAVKKGILLQQREKLWSRWKERYCILTRDYLHCFRRTTSIHRSGVRLSEMGSFIFKLRLADVEEIDWETRRCGSLIAIVLPQESRILLRVLSDNYESLHQWYTLLQECVYMSKERRRALRNLHIPSSNTNTSKSQGSPNSSSNSNSNSDNEKSSTSGNDSKDNKSLRKNIGRLSLKLNHKTGSLRKYSTLVDVDDDEEEDEENEGDNYDDPEYNEYPEEDRGDEETKVTLRHKEKSSMTLNDFMKNPWRPGGNNGGTCSRSTIMTGYSIPIDSRDRNGATTTTNGSSNNNNNTTSRTNNGRPRPESWTPQPQIFYRSPSLVPSQWVNKRDLLASNGGGATFGRSSVYCPSRHTTEITFRKMS